MLADAAGSPISRYESASTRSTLLLRLQALVAVSMSKVQCVYCWSISLARLVVKWHSWLYESPGRLIKWCRIQRWNLHGRHGSHDSDSFSGHFDTLRKNWCSWLPEVERADGRSARKTSLESYDEIDVVRWWLRGLLGNRCFSRVVQGRIHRCAHRF